MKRIVIFAAAALSLAGCAQVRELTHHETNPYEKPPFYAKYLNTGSTVDNEINRVLAELKANPQAASQHNALGALLVQKGFTKDAQVEFERAVDVDGRYYPAWYNLGLVRAANGDDLGARRAFAQTIDVKPGHSAALFQLGLIEEKRLHTDRAIDLYAKAFSINPKLMDVAVNPRILDSKLVDMALLRMYSSQHTRKTMHFQDAPDVTAITMSQIPPNAPAPKVEPPPQPLPHNSMNSSAPVTDPAAAPTTQSRRRRPRTPQTTAPPEQTPAQPTPPTEPENPPGR
jgi:tetratricopeptide (TPR) repeat protein